LSDLLESGRTRRGGMHAQHSLQRTAPGHASDLFYRRAASLTLGHAAQCLRAHFSEGVAARPITASHLRARMQDWQAFRSRWRGRSSFAGLYSITSSARASRVVGTLRPMSLLSGRFILEDQAEQEMHVAAVGSAFRRLGSIGSPHLAQVPYVPSDIRFRAASI
jgi:hypothetical protein